MIRSLFICVLAFLPFPAFAEQRTAVWQDIWGTMSLTLGEYTLAQTEQNSALTIWSCDGCPRPVEIRLEQRVKTDGVEGTLTNPNYMIVAEACRYPPCAQSHGRIGPYAYTRKSSNIKDPRHGAVQHLIVLDQDVLALQIWMDFGNDIDPLWTLDSIAFEQLALRIAMATQ